MENDHLSELCFEEILRDLLRIEKVKILDVEIKPAAGEGDNILGEVYRVGLKYTQILEDLSKKRDGHVSLIVKIITNKKNGLCLKYLSTLFFQELKSLLDVMPRIEKFVGDSLAPRLYYCNKNIKLIVMEDLATRGFTTVDRYKGLSLAHTLVAIKKIALFHAGSVALVEKKPQLIRYFNGENWKKYFSTNFVKFIENSIQNIIDGVENWNEYKEIASELKKLKKGFESHFFEVYNFEPGEFCVLNHGDLWITNILFKHDENDQPMDALLVDFQMMRYTSPAIDLQHFLAMCPEIEIKYENDDYLLKKYLEILEITMRKMGCKTKPPRLEELKIAIYKRRIYSVLTGLIYYSRSLVNNEDNESLKEILENGTTNLNLFENPNIAKALFKTLKILHKRGYLV